MKVSIKFVAGGRVEILDVVDYVTVQAPNGIIRHSILFAEGGLPLSEILRMSDTPGIQMMADKTGVHASVPADICAEVSVSA